MLRAGLGGGRRASRTTRAECGTGAATAEFSPSSWRISPPRMLRHRHLLVSDRRVLASGAFAEAPAGRAGEFRAHWALRCTCWPGEPLRGPGMRARERGRAGARHPVLYAAAVVRMAITGPALQRRTCVRYLPRGIASRQRAPVRAPSLPAGWLHPRNIGPAVATPGRYGEHRTLVAQGLPPIRLIKSSRVTPYWTPSASSQSTPTGSGRIRDASSASWV